MNIEIDLTPEQITLLATKLGWTAQLEDTSAELIGDEYPLIENPMAAEEFAQIKAKELIAGRLSAALRSELITTVNNLNNQILEKITSGVLDGAIMTMTTQQVLNLIIAGLNEQT